MTARIGLLLGVLASVGAIDTLQVTNLFKASIAFGTGCTSEEDAVFGGSDGMTSGVFVTHDGGQTVE